MSVTWGVRYRDGDRYGRVEQQPDGSVEVRWDDGVTTVLTPPEQTPCEVVRDGEEAVVVVLPIVRH